MMITGCDQQSLCILHEVQHDPRFTNFSFNPRRRGDGWSERVHDPKVREGWTAPDGAAWAEESYFD
jgi:hypothetical protein